MLPARDLAADTGFALAVEIDEWSRSSGSSIGAYLGLVPTETSSGESRTQGSITKTGNRHARRLLVEAAWHHDKPYKPSKALQHHFDASPVDEAVAASYGRLAAAVVAAGRRPRARTMDLLIAATAHAHSARVYTRNAKDFVGADNLVEIVAV